MAAAYMFIDGQGRQMTRVYDSNKELVKIVPTDPSQIRKPRVSQLWSSGPPPEPPLGRLDPRFVAWIPKNKRGSDDPI